MSKIVPAVSSKMWYFSGQANAASVGGNFLNSMVPFDATVIFVHTADIVNLRVTDHLGNTFTETSVTIAEYRPNRYHGDERCVCWMPYQSQQAAAQAKQELPEADKVNQTPGA